MYSRSSSRLSLVSDGTTELSEKTRPMADLAFSIKAMWLLMVLFGWCAASLGRQGRRGGLSWSFLVYLLVDRGVRPELLLAPSD